MTTRQPNEINSCVLEKNKFVGVDGTGLFKQFRADRMRSQRPPPCGAKATAFANPPPPVKAVLAALKAVTRSARPVLSRWSAILSSISGSIASLSCITHAGKVFTRGALTTQEYTLPLFTRN